MNSIDRTQLKQTHALNHNGLDVKHIKYQEKKDQLNNKLNKIIKEILDIETKIKELSSGSRRERFQGLLLDSKLDGMIEKQVEIVQESSELDAKWEKYVSDQVEIVDQLLTQAEENVKKLSSEELLIVEDLFDYMDKLEEFKTIGDEVTEEDLQEEPTRVKIKSIEKASTFEDMANQIRLMDDTLNISIEKLGKKSRRKLIHVDSAQHGVIVSTDKLYKAIKQFNDHVKAISS